MAEIFRAPIIIRIPPRPPLKSDVYSWILSIYQPNPDRPFSQEIWDPVAPPKKKAGGEVNPAYTITIEPPRPNSFFPDDWPLPTRARPPQFAESYTWEYPLAQPNPPAPFNEDKWPSAWPRKFKAIGDVWGTVNVVLTPNPDRPFWEDEWRRPAAPKARAAGEPYDSPEPLIRPNPTRPFRETDWESAAPRKAKAIGEAYDSPAPLVTPNPEAPFAQSDWENATLPKLKAGGEALSSPGEAPEAQPPFSKSEWENATPGRTKVTFEPSSQGAPALLTPNPELPFGQTEWESATLGRPKASGETFALQLQDRPFNVYDWESATLAKPKSIQEALQINDPVLNPNPAQPFVQSDWWMFSVRRSAKIDDFTNLTALYNTIIVFPPPGESEWHLPARAKPPIEAESLGTNLPLLQPNPFAPFAQLDWWRFPVSRKALVDDVENLLPIQSAIVVVYPFSEAAWNLPTRARSPVDADSFGRVQPLLEPNPSQPFAEETWPGAVRARTKQQSEVYDTNNPLLTPNPDRPFSEENWPSSIKIPKQISKFDILGMPTSILLQASQLPFSQEDWARPQAARREAKVDAVLRNLTLIAPNPASPFTAQASQNFVMAKKASKAQFDTIPNTLGMLTTVVGPGVTRIHTTRLGVIRTGSLTVR